jgi:hypothetical protein
MRHINVEKFEKEAIDLAKKDYGNNPSFAGGSLYVEMRDEDHAELFRADLENFANANWGDGDKNSPYGTAVKMYKLANQNGRTEFVYDFVPSQSYDVPPEVDVMMTLEAEMARGK